MCIKVRSFNEHSIKQSSSEKHKRQLSVTLLRQPIKYISISIIHTNVNGKNDTWDFLPCCEFYQAVSLKNLKTFFLADE